MGGMPEVFRILDSFSILQLENCSMAHSLYELLGSAVSHDNATDKYLNRLSTLSLTALTSSESESLSQSSHSNLLSLQSLSARSNTALVTSTEHLFSLHDSLSELARHAETLKSNILKLDETAVSFAEKYSRNAGNEVLDRRKTALLMARNADRVSDILDLPNLLSTTVQRDKNYAAALDLHSHIKRLRLLYKDSAIVNTVYAQAEEAIFEMNLNLIASLRSQNIKLAVAMRTVGWLRRVTPDMPLDALFLTCRLATLTSMLSALEPFRNLADQEAANSSNSNTWSGGQQTERFLKRYIEIFREQSFNIISMYKSIFPDPAMPQETVVQDRPLPALATFSAHLVSLLMATLKTYLPIVRDKSSRESLLTQVLYCAGSLGRLGGDFSLLLASDDEEDDEWVAVMKKHRFLAGKLEKLASGAER